MAWAIVVVAVAVRREWSGDRLKEHLGLYVRGVRERGKRLYQPCLGS